MELRTLILRLWRCRRYVAVVALVAACASVASAYDVSASPFKLTPKNFKYAIANSAILVDSPRSAYGDVRRDMGLGQLTLRAAVYAQLARSNTAVVAVERAAGMPPGRVTAAGPWVGVAERWDTVLPSPARSTQVRTEGNPWRISYDNQINVPIIDVQVQAPTAQAAIRLADNAGAGVRAAVAELRLEGALKPTDQVAVRQAAPAQATLVDPGAAKIIMLLAFIAVFSTGCLIALTVVTVAPHLRRRAEPAHAAVAGRTAGVPAS